MPTQSTTPGRATGAPTRSPSVLITGSLPARRAARTRSGPSVDQNAPSMSAVTGRMSWCLLSGARTTGISAPGAPTRMNRNEDVPSVSERTMKGGPGGSVRQGHGGPCEQAAVDRQRDAGDEAGALTEQERDGFGDLT